MKTLITHVLRQPKLTITLAIAFTMLALTGAFNASGWSVPFKNDYKVFFKPGNAQLQDFQNLQRTYTKSDNVIFIVAPKDGDVFTKETLTAIRTLTEAAWQLPHSIRVDSLANFQHSYGVDEGIAIENLVTGDTSLDKMSIEKIKAIALNDPSLINALISATGDVALIHVTIRLPEENMTTVVPEIARAAQALQLKFSQTYPQINFMLSGIVMMNASFQEIAQFDSATRIPAMVVLVMIVIALIYRSLSAVLATASVVIFSVAGTMGLWGWLGGYLTGPSTTAPVVILTLSVADCVHILSHYQKNLLAGIEKLTAIKISILSNLKPIFLTSLTTALGFLTMNFSDSPPFIGLGNLVAIGVTLAFFLAVTLFPAVLALMPPVSTAYRTETSTFSTRLGNWVIDKHRTIIRATIILVSGFILLIPLNELNDDFVDYFNKSLPFRQATDFMQSHVSGITTLELSIDSNTPDAAMTPEFVQFVDEFTQWLEAIPSIRHVTSPTVILRSLNKSLHGDNPDWYQLPETRQAIAQYLLLYEMSLPQGLDLNNQWNVDKSSMRVVATFGNLSSKEILKLERSINEKFDAYAKPYRLTIASPSLMFAHIGSSNIINMLHGTLIALLLISVIIGFALRSFKYGLISLLPNLAPAAIAFGLWAVIDGEVGLGLSVVMGISLGIIVDNTIHFLTKYVYASQKPNMSAAQAILYSYESVGQALISTTLMLMGGFLIMATSSLKVNADMGALTAITLLIALVVDLLFLPPLLLWFDRQKKISPIALKTQRLEAA